MPTRKPLITHSDHRQLMQLLDRDHVTCIADQQTLLLLRDRLETALLVDDDRIPATVVTMESVVQIHDILSGNIDIFTLVFPEQANIVEGKLSVMAPIGTAIIGRHVGQFVHGRVPNGKRRLEIVDILFQPEHDDRPPLSLCRVPKSNANCHRQPLTT